LVEELLCDVRIISKLGVGVFTENLLKYDYHWFLAEVVSGRIEIGEPDKFNEFKYIQIENLRNYKLSPNMKKLLYEIENRKIKLW